MSNDTRPGAGAASVAEHKFVIASDVIPRPPLPRALQMARAEALNYKHALDELLAERLDAATPLTRNEAADKAQTERQEKLFADLMHGDEIGNLPKPRPLIDGILDLDTLAAIYGPSGCGKSFIALDFAATVATGGVWQGVTVDRRSVLYVTAEGAHGMGDRLAAWSSQFKEAPDLKNLHWLTQAVSLFDPAWAEALAFVARELGVKLVVIDTLARSMTGGDENSTEDMGVVIANADILKRATGACVLFVHHTGWVEGHARGSSAFKAALDTELEVKANGGSIALKATKQRHREDGQQWHLRLEPREPSAVVVLSTGPTISDLRGTMRDTLDALAKVDAGAGTSSTEWRKATGADVPERTFYNHRRDLLALGLAEGISDGKRLRYRITETGQNELARDTAITAMALP